VTDKVAAILGLCVVTYTVSVSVLLGMHPDQLTDHLTKSHTEIITLIVGGLLVYISKENR